MKWQTPARTALYLALFYSFSLGAANTEALSLQKFLDDVRTHNPDARATIQNIASFEARTREADVPITPEAYVSFGLLDDKKPTAVPIFTGTETRATHGRVGLREQTDYGLGADVFVSGQRTNIGGVSTAFLPNSDYFESSAGVALTQSFWRNGFGEGTKAQIEANKANNDLNLLQARFRLKTLLLNAQNAYWSVVTSNQIVKLQEENVERAKKLRDYMSNRTKLRLFDDTDEMQALAAYESRALELQSSLDDRAVMVRQLNTLRGMDSDAVGDLEGLPTDEMMNQVEKNPTGHMTREDFDMLRAQAKAGLAQARYAKSQINPQFDVQAAYSTNGKDGITQLSAERAETTQFPTWSVGFTFSVPLDFGLIKDLRRGYRSAGLASESLQEQAQFSEARAWDDLVKQKTEAQGRYARSLNVEKIQTDLVKRERQRLLNGRATTFESLSFEQNLALAQIQRVRSQLALLQISNAIKTFEAK